MIGRTARLEFHPVLGTVEGDRKPAGNELMLADEQGTMLRLGLPALIVG